MRPAELAVLGDICAAAPRLPAEGPAALAAHLQAAAMTHVLGVGRSGLILRTFAMRLAQLGLPVQMAGDTCARAAAAGEHLLVASASGATPGVLAVAGRARDLGLDITLLGGTAGAPLARLASRVILLPGGGDGPSPAGQPPGSLFGQMLFCFLEECVLHLSRALDPAHRGILSRHANLE